MNYSQHCQIHVTPNHFLPLARPFPWHGLQSFYSNSMGIIRIICLILLQNNKSLQNTERGTFGKTHEQLTLWWWHINIEQYAWWPSFGFALYTPQTLEGQWLCFGCPISIWPLQSFEIHTIQVSFLDWTKEKLIINHIPVQLILVALSLNC